MGCRHKQFGEPTAESGQRKAPQPCYISIQKYRAGGLEVGRQEKESKTCRPFSLTTGQSDRLTDLQVDNNLYRHTATTRIPDGLGLS